jgi:hypothetical protein
MAIESQLRHAPTHRLRSRTTDELLMSADHSRRDPKCQVAIAMCGSSDPSGPNRAFRISNVFRAMKRLKPGSGLRRRGAPGNRLGTVPAVEAAGRPERSHDPTRLAATAPEVQVQYDLEPGRRPTWPPGRLCLASWPTPREVGLLLTSSGHDRTHAAGDGGNPCRA